MQTNENNNEFNRLSQTSVLQRNVSRAKSFGKNRNSEQLYSSSPTNAKKNPMVRKNYSSLTVKTLCQNQQPKVDASKVKELTEELNESSMQKEPKQRHQGKREHHLVRSTPDNSLFGGRTTPAELDRSGAQTPNLEKDYAIDMPLMAKTANQA